MNSEEKLKLARSMIEEYLCEPAILISLQDVLEGTLAFWKNAQSIPTRKAVSFVSRTGEIFIPNLGTDYFCQTIFNLKPNLSDIDELCRLVTLMSPGVRIAIRELSPYMKNIASIWHAPRFRDGYFEAFFENSTTGKIERLVIDSEFEMKIEVVGEGLKFSLR